MRTSAAPSCATKPMPRPPSDSRDRRLPLSSARDRRERGGPVTNRVDATQRTSAVTRRRAGLRHVQSAEPGAVAAAVSEGERAQRLTADRDTHGVTRDRAVDFTTTDALVIALAQLVRDRWDAERRTPREQQRTIAITVMSHLG